MQLVVSQSAAADQQLLLRQSVVSLRQQQLVVFGVSNHLLELQHIYHTCDSW